MPSHITPRINALETRVLALESAQDARIRQLVDGYIESKFRDLQRAVGPAGKDGAQGIRGERGEQGIRGDRGEPGAQGISGCSGPKGDRGEPGRDGKDGADSTVPGPQGIQGIRGEKGDTGPRGDVTIVSDDEELRQAVISIRRKMLLQRANFLAKIDQRISDNEKLGVIGRHFAEALRQLRQEVADLE